MTQDKERKLIEIFRAVFTLGPGSDVSGVCQSTTPAWDSLAHVTLVAALESEFGISIDLADSLALTSYGAVKLYLEKLGE